MYLIYLDESGNTGNNLQETQQPIFVLAALLVPKPEMATTRNGTAAIDTFFPAPRPRLLKSMPTNSLIPAVLQAVSYPAPRGLLQVMDGASSKTRA